MLNFVYCLDSNYNTQCICSIYSLLENVDEKIKITLIHQDKSTMCEIPSSILNHPYLEVIEVRDKISLLKEYPMIGGTHVSEATYYRLNIDSYFKENEDYIIYLDCDVICIKNPLPLIKKTINNIEQSNKVLAAMTEHELVDHGISNLKMKSNKYFNAGVLIINIDMWKQEQITQKLLLKLEQIKKEIVFWDQDVLNAHFDGSFIELNENLNHQVKMEDKSKEEIKNTDGIVFLHYSGKFKPWTVRGAYNSDSQYFQKIYRTLYADKYYIDYNYKVNALKDLLYGILTFKLFFLNYRFNALKVILKSFFK